jgi:hypothetical protein
MMPPLFKKLSQLWRRLLFYARRERFDCELEEEMRFHLEMKAEENLAAGISPEEARYAAQRQFGNQTVQRQLPYPPHYLSIFVTDKGVVAS